MFEKTRLFHCVLLISLIPLIAGCSEAPSNAPAIDPTPVPATATLPVASAEPSPQSLPSSVPIEIRFDGEGCSGALPKELPLGEHAFNLLDQTDLQAELWLVRLKDGKSFQDLLAMQSAPGEWDPKPRWAAYDTQLSRESLETDHGRLESTSWKFYLEGEHVVYCYIPSPQMIYYAGPILVSDGLTE